MRDPGFENHDAATERRGYSKRGDTAPRLQRTRRHSAAATANAATERRGYSLLFFHPLGDWKDRCRRHVLGHRLGLICDELAQEWNEEKERNPDDETARAERCEELRVLGVRR